MNTQKQASKRQIFEPIHLGSLEVKNRLVRASTSMEMADERGLPGENLLRLYGDLARGGAGLVITDFTYVLREDQVSPADLGLYDDAQIPHFQELASIILVHGAKACLQIGFGGSMTGYKVGERQIWGPSAVEHPFTKVTPKAMTRDDIRAAVQAMADAAVRAKRAGFDAVQPHFVHNYMLNQFLVPYFNRRSDEYGGTIENRARLAFEIMEAIRKAVGSDYPVIPKIHGQDYLEEGGMTREEGIFLAEGLAHRGATAIEVSGGNLISTPEKLPIRAQITKDPAAQSYFREDSAAIGRAVDVPLILTGGNRDAGVMGEVLATVPSVVAFGLCRTLLSEPDLPKTWQQDPTATPRCTACNWCIQHFGEGPTRCVLDEK